MKRTFNKEIFVATLLCLYFTSQKSLANEICKDALKKADLISERAKIISACQAGGHGSNDKLLKTLLAKCDKLATKDLKEGCKVDAFRYISWFEYP